MSIGGLDIGAFDFGGLDFGGFNFSALHFLRPQWLWLLLGLPLLAWVLKVRRRRAQAWRDWVDPHLLPQLLDSNGARRMRNGAWLVWPAALAAIFALAGPSWRQSEQPLWQTRMPLVIALDLSSATAAADLPPSRLLQARSEIAQLLQARAGAQVGLVAFAGDAFTVAPLTDDAANVALFLDALEPGVMPVDGQRADRAIHHAQRLLEQAGFSRGEILLLTDHADAAARRAAAEAATAGFRVSAMGLGDARGAPYRDADGAIRQARLDTASLQGLAGAGGGAYAAVAAGDGDLRALGLLQVAAADAVSARGAKGTVWQDEGYWLLPVLMLLSLLVFRRGGALAVLCVALLLPVLPAQAATGSWWQRPDQQAHARMRAGIEAYRRGDHAAAAAQWQGIDSADAHYNRGNALAKAGQYPQAIAAYDQALKQQPRMADAITNRRAVLAAMKRKPPPGPGKNDRGRGSEKQQNPPSSKSGQPPKEPRGQAPANKSPDQQAGKSKDVEPPKPADAATQQQADAAQRARMQEALRNAQQAQSGQQAQAAAQRRETPQQREQRMATQAWLKRVPDDPGSLLRRKFALEYERRRGEGGD